MSDSDDVSPTGDRRQQRTRPPAPKRSLAGSTKKHRRRQNSSSTSDSSASLVMEARPRKARRTQTRSGRGWVSTAVRKDKAGARVIPPWNTLPYHVLVNVFTQACDDAREYHGSSMPPDMQWLLSASRVCRAFAEPALTVLYQSPYLYPPLRAHRFLKLLKNSPETTLFNYRRKVQEIRIRVYPILSHACPGEGRLDLATLVGLLPRFQELELLLSIDPVPARSTSTKSLGPVYSDDLFASMEAANIRLRSWSWNDTLAKAALHLPRLREVHRLPSFQSLVSLAFVDVPNSHFGFMEPSPHADRIETSLIDAVYALPHLKALSFTNSHALNEDILQLLPSHLTSLALLNCPFVDAKALQSYLGPRGSQLRELILRHNIALDLSFLSDLACSCPRLQSLHVDLYEITICGGQLLPPAFEILLLPSVTPTWPSTLHTLELLHLHKWCVEVAEVLLASLVRSAPSLPCLRRLVLKGSLQINWRERARFRDVWAPRMLRVFLRRPDPPAWQLMSFKKWRAFKSGTMTAPAPADKPKGKRAGTKSAIASSRQKNRARGGTEPVIAPPAPRRSTRLRANGPPTTLPKTGSGAGSELDSDDLPLAVMEMAPQLAHSEATSDRSKGGPKTRGARVTKELQRLVTGAGKDRLRSPLPIPDEGGKGKGKARHESDSLMDEPRQGMCDVVELRLDNQRPMLFEYTESHFLDEPDSGDEEWNGQDLIGDEIDAWYDDVDSLMDEGGWYSSAHPLQLLFSSRRAFERVLGSEAAMWEQLLMVIGYRHRHLLNDLHALLPHSRKDAKLDTKTKLYQLNELAEMYNCNNVFFFEARKGKDLYLWLSKAPNGPCVKMHLQNLHTMEELHFTGNCLKGSRPILSFDSTFDSQPHLRVIKELFLHIFGVPKGARKSKPFIDHVMGFTIADGKIWIRCYQIHETDASRVAADPDVEEEETVAPRVGAAKETKLSLVEIGPRFVMTPIVILEGSFGGPVIFQNREFVSPNQIRAELRVRSAGKYNSRSAMGTERKLKRGELGLRSHGGRQKPKSELDDSVLFA
ncbi:MAG: Ribosome biogenesis protein brx1 [Phylliscum demangeonii]|nr:MAG: Ribosome biogenesis protein brx1 [Phylliscum demangeonii]